MKKIFKSLVAALIAVCIGMVTIVVPSVSADTYRLGDINGDGYVNTADVTILAKYLSGLCEISRHSAADVNFDCVISMEDCDMLMKYVSKQISLPTNTTAELTVPSMDTYRNYTIYNYENKSTSSYTLTANVELLSLENEVMATVEDDRIDDRVRATDTSVVQVTPGGGTGFIIDDHIIATAAHCVYSEKNNSFYENTQIVVRGAPYSNISMELDRCNVVEVHVPQMYLDSYDRKYDYALIYVEEDLSEYGMFDMGISSYEFMDTQTTLTISGFPAKTASNESAGNMALYKDDGIVYNIGSYIPAWGDSMIICDAFASSGVSGAPIYMTSSYGDVDYRTAVGICIGAILIDYDGDGEQEYISIGVRPTSNQLRFYYNNNYIGSTVT